MKSNKIQCYSSGGIGTKRSTINIDKRIHGDREVQGAQFPTNRSQVIPSLDSRLSNLDIYGIWQSMIYICEYERAWYIYIPWELDRKIESLWCIDEISYYPFIYMCVLKHARNLGVRCKQRVHDALVQEWGRWELLWKHAKIASPGGHVLLGRFESNECTHDIQFTIRRGR